MKTANVVSVQDRGFTGASAQTRNGNRVESMTRLLRLYPEISEEEHQSLLTFLTKGAQEEIIEVTQLQGLEPRYLAFRKDHPREFPAGVRAWLPLIIFALVAIIGIAWRMSL